MIEKKVNLGGRPPTSEEKISKAREITSKLASIGCTDKEIGHIVGFSEDVLKKKLRDELDEGRSNLRASLRKAQVELAVKDKNPTMLIWLGKSYLGQKEPKHNIEHTGGLTVERVMFGSEEVVEKVNEVIEIEATYKEENRLPNINECFPGVRSRATKEN